jgi:hypothetical protein
LAAFANYWDGCPRDPVRTILNVLLRGNFVAVKLGSESALSALNAVSPKKDLHSVQVSRGTYSSTWSMADEACYVDESVALLRQAKRQSERARRVAAKFTERQRLPRERRMITDSHLRLVAEVYRENLRSGPTKAVGKHFGVANRMASTYVDKARKAGYLPPTKQGQKKA